MSLEKEKGVSGEEEKGKETYFLKWTFFCFFLGGGVWASGSSLWVLSCSHCYTEFGYLSLWEDGIACSWLQMFATHNVRVISLLR